MEPEEIQGVDPQQLEEAATAMEALIAAALAAVAATAAADMLIPGIPLVDIDALSVIPTLWTQRAERDLIPELDRIIRRVALTLQGEIDEALPLSFPPIAEISDTTAAQILAGARNRLVGIGDLLWFNARTSLVQGVELGEDVPALAARVRDAAQVTEPRSRTIARTSVISASNAASIAQARSAGVGMEKGWLATEDDRTRPAHVAADGQWVPLDDMFEVGGELLDFPGDPSGRADNVINERCSIIYRIVGVTPTVAAARNYVRDEEGQFADTPGLAARDVLGLARRISLNEGESFIASDTGKIQSGKDESGVPMALVSTPEGPRLRLGEESNGDATSWDADPDMSVRAELSPGQIREMRDNLAEMVKVWDREEARAHELGRAVSAAKIYERERVTKRPATVDEFIETGRRTTYDVSYEPPLTPEEEHLNSEYGHYVDGYPATGQLTEGVGWALRGTDVSEPGEDERLFASIVFGSEPLAGDSQFDSRRDVRSYQRRLDNMLRLAEADESGPTVASADRHYVRDNDGQFARTPGTGLPGMFDRLDSFTAEALEAKFGRPVETVTVGEESEDDTQRLRIRIFPDGTSHLSNDMRGPDGEEGFQPFTDQLTSDELREMAESLESAIDFDPDDYDEDDDDEDGIMAWVRGVDGVNFGRYRNGDIRLVRETPVDRADPDQSEMYLYDFSEDEQQDLLRELNDAADRQEELEAELEAEPEDDLSEAIYIDTEGMGEVYTVPRPEDGQVEISFPDQPNSSMGLDKQEAEALSAALGNARQQLGGAPPNSEEPFFSESLTFGPYSGMKLEGYNADGTYVFQITGTGVLDRIGTIHLEGDDPEEFERILDEALDALEAGPVTSSAAVPHLHTCTEGVQKVNGRWPPGPCKGWKSKLPGGDPRRAAPKKKAAPRKRALAPNDPGLTEGMNPAHRGAAEQAVIDRARTRGEMLAEFAELVQEGAPADVLEFRAGARRRAMGADLDPAGEKVIAAALSGDKDKMRRAVKAAAKKWGLSQVGTWDETMPFDVKQHRTFGGGAAVRPEAGGPVLLERPGFTFRDHEGNDLNLVKAVVRKAPQPETPDTREDAARARQAKIDVARNRANVLAEIEELLLNEEEPEIRARNVRKLAERLKVQDDPTVAGVLAAAGGDREDLLQKVKEAAGSFGLRRIGAPQQPFDPRQHRALGSRPREGALVDLVRPGYTATVDGEQVQVEKAVVETSDPRTSPAPSGEPKLGDMIARERPSDAETVAQAQAVYGGTFGGLTAVVTESTPVHTGAKFILVSGNVNDAAGNRVGTFTRAISEKNGKFIARNSSLNLSPKVRGQGFAEGFNANAVDWYRDNGIAEVHLIATEVGGYAWARAGYDFASPQSATAVLMRVLEATEPGSTAHGDVNSKAARIPKERLAAQRLLAGELFDRSEGATFGNAGYPTPYEISQLGRWPSAGKDDMWIGKAIMLDSSWEGVRYL